MAKNECGKTRPRDNPYERWVSFDGSWTWEVLKKWQADDDKPYARWFCNVITPYVPDGEMGDVYVADIKQNAHKVTTPLERDLEALDRASGTMSNGAVLADKVRRGEVRR